MDEQDEVYYKHWVYYDEKTEQWKDGGEYLANLVINLEDLTQEEWESLKSNLTNYYKRYESVYTTTQENEINIPINISQYNTLAILEVYIEGRMLNRNEYAINGTNSITLNIPLSEIGTKVHFIVYRSVCASNEDLNELKGPKGDSGAIVFDTIAEMKEDEDLVAGDTCQILEDTGLYEIINDNSVAVNNQTVFELDNGLKAQLLYYTDINKQYYTLYQPCLDETNDLGTFNLLVFSNGFTILNDCGYTGEETAIQSFMSNLNITHLDVVMISHFHGDHAGCFEYIARNYCDNRTLFFRQMECNYSNFTIGENTAANLDALYTSTLTELGYINNSRVPNQNETIVVNNGLVKLRFLNTDPNFLQGYYDAQSDTNTDNYTKSTLNNLSMICEVSAFGKKLLFNGDIEEKGQENNWEYLTKCDIMQVPHHNWNHNGFHKFFKAISPEIAYYNRNSSETTDPYVYWAKFQRQCIGYVPTYQTYKQDVIIKISNNGINVIDGYKENTFNIPYGQDQLVAYIPYYTDNSRSFFTYANWTIKDVIEMLRDLPEDISTSLIASSRYTKFNEEVAAITTVSTDWILSSIHRGFELKRKSEWDGRIFRFLEGFDYNNTSTYANRFLCIRTMYDNKSENTNFEIGEGETYTLPNSLRAVPTLYGRIKMTEGTSTNIYSVVFRNSDKSNLLRYEAIDTRVAVASNQAFLRAINCNITLSGNTVTLNTCKLVRKNLTNDTVADIFSCKLVELSSTYLI